MLLARCAWLFFQKLLQRRLLSDFSGIFEYYLQNVDPMKHAFPAVESEIVMVDYLTVLASRIDRFLDC